MSEGKRYIDVPAADLMESLRAIGKAIEGKGGKIEEGVSGKEITISFTPPNRATFVRIYTSLGTGRSTVRGCGQDAVRIVVGAKYKDRFKILTDKKRIYRTAPQGERADRISAFLERLKDAIREAYRVALDTPACPACEAPMALRTNKGSGNRFFGCIGFPDCKATKPFKARNTQ